MKRVFAAIDISDGVRQMIEQYMTSLRQKFETSRVRWEKPEKLHLTVKFAGSLDGNGVDKFKCQIRAAVASVAPFRIVVNRTGAFVKHRGPIVLWLGTEVLKGEPDPFKVLSEHLHHKSSAKPFRPHITIARIKDAKKAKELIDKHLASYLEPVEFKVSELEIYESILLPTGSVYRKLESINLSKEKRPS